MILPQLLIVYKLLGTIRSMYKRFFVPILAIVVVLVTIFNLYFFFKVRSQFKETESQTTNNLQLIFDLTRASSCLLHVKNVIPLSNEVYKNLNCDVVIGAYNAELNKSI